MGIPNVCLWLATPGRLVQEGGSLRPDLGLFLDLLQQLQQLQHQQVYQTAVRIDSRSNTPPRPGRPVRDSDL